MIQVFELFFIEITDIHAIWEKKNSSFVAFIRFNDTVSSWLILSQ